MIIPLTCHYKIRKTKETQRKLDIVDLDLHEDLELAKAERFVVPYSHDVGYHHSYRKANRAVLTPHRPMTH